MLFKRLAELHQQLDTNKFSLLINVVDEDIEFHKSIGTEYNEDKLVNLVDNTVKMIERI